MSGFTNLTADAIVTTHPAVLDGIVLLASSNGGDVTVYDGQDTGGRKIGQFKGLANLSLSVAFSPALDCDSGIYVDVGSNVTEVLILWSPAE